MAPGHKKAGQKETEEQSLRGTVTALDRSKDGRDLPKISRVVAACDRRKDDRELTWKIFGGVVSLRKAAS
jgi:hypothetical protein